MSPWCRSPRPRLLTMLPRRSASSISRTVPRCSSATAMAARSSPKPAFIRTSSGLVYVAAHAPDVGEDEGALGKKTPSVLAKTDGAIKKTPDGFTYLDPAEFPKLFAPDLPRERAEFVARSQVLAAAKVFSTPLTAAAWKTKPSWGIVAGSDQIINPDLERWYYERAKSHTTRDPRRQPLGLRVSTPRKSRPSSPTPPAASSKRPRRHVEYDELTHETRGCASRHFRHVATRQIRIFPHADVHGRRYQEQDSDDLAATPRSARCPHRSWRQAGARQDRRGARRDAAAGSRHPAGRSGLPGRRQPEAGRSAQHRAAGGRPRQGQRPAHGAVRRRAAGTSRPLRPRRREEARLCLFRPAIGAHRHACCSAARSSSAPCTPISSCSRATSSTSRRTSR